MVCVFAWFFRLGVVFQFSVFLSGGLRPLFSFVLAPGSVSRVGGAFFLVQPNSWVAWVGFPALVEVLRAFSLFVT